MIDDDFPEEVRRALEQAQREDVIAILDHCLTALALAQNRAQVRGIISTVEANRDVTVSTLVDQDGKNSAPYARIDRNGNFTRLGTITPPKK